MEFANREEWLAYRRGGIGASDAAILLGISKWSSPELLLKDKRGLIPLDDSPPNEAAEIGSLMEPVITTLYERRTGRKVVKEQVCVTHPDYPIIRATLDAIDDAGQACEWKSTSPLGWGTPGSEEIPAYYRAQAVHQLLASGTDSIVFGAVMNAKYFQMYRIERDEAECQRYLEAALRFWECVESGELYSPPLASKVLKFTLTKPKAK